MSALPPDIGNLRKLMALKLVDNMDLTTLPTTIGELCELRNLKIWGTFLTRVPSNGSLTKLEIAEIWTTDAVMLPKGLLYDLRRLKKLHITFKWNHESIDHNLLIKGLPLLTLLEVLEMHGWPFANGDEIELALQSMLQLRDLTMEGFRIHEISMRTTGFLPQIKVLRILKCDQLERLQFHKGVFQNLSNLVIGDCKRLQYVTGLQHLQHLTEIYVYHSGNTVDVALEINEGHFLGCYENSVSFPNLQRLGFSSMRKMKRICSDNVSLPSLREFRLFDCPQVKKLPNGLLNHSGMFLSGGITGTRKWWDGLEWKNDKYFKSCLQHLLHEKH